MPKICCFLRGVEPCISLLPLLISMIIMLMLLTIMHRLLIIMLMMLMVQIIINIVRPICLILQCISKSDVLKHQIAGLLRSFLGISLKFHFLSYDVLLAPRSLCLYY